MTVKTKSSQHSTPIGWDEQILEVRVSCRTADVRGSIFSSRTLKHVEALNLVLMGLHHPANTKYGTSLRTKRLFLSVACNYTIKEGVGGFITDSRTLILYHTSIASEAQVRFSLSYTLNQKSTSTDKLKSSLWLCNLLLSNTPKTHKHYSMTV